MKHIKIFEKYSDDIDVVYIKELIEDFCIDNNFVDLSHINPLFTYSEVVYENIINKDILHFKIDERINILFFNLIFFVKSLEGLSLFDWELPLKSESLYSLRYDSMESFDLLINKVIKSLSREGFRVWESEIYEQKIVYGVHIFKLKKFISYKK